ncbi:MAG TPA: hypothetical protein VFB08_05275 [Burkholderiales bacterium]|nr:hypothetical protein [Burkholderiales bacterium]
MSAPEKPVAAAAKDPYYDLAERIYIGLSARVYSVFGEQKKPDPKALATFSFKLADAFEEAFRETPREKARIEALNKASVKMDQVDLSSMFAATTPPKK